ncbi:TIGR02678 family protein [Nocardia sp. NPDC058480]|uniref:TIGR02678 family protein n=1 Tax=Nocardia sp. NPDC058480 TaxID=3346522 RepID=UPI00365AEBD9
MSDLTNQLAIAEREEVGRGIRYLLVQPMLTENFAPDRFDVVRRRRDPITKWFDYYCGWSVTVEPRLGYARLTKVRVATDASRSAKRIRTQRSAFDRRRYVLLCVVAAELCTTQVTTIGLLAGNVQAATGSDPLLTTFDTANRAERRAFVDALRLLESYGVLDPVDGVADSYVDSEQAKVLFRVDVTRLLRLFANTVGPSQMGVPVAEVALRLSAVLGELTREPRYGDAAGPLGRHADTSTVSSTQRNLWLRHSVFRRVVDDPVLYFDDLDADELAYLTSITGRRFLREAAEIGGFVLEERAEGVLFVDPDAIATDTKFPDDTSTAKLAGLLLLDEMVGPTTVEQLRRRATTLLQRFPRWARTYQADDGPARLVADALVVLREFQLIRTTTAGLVIPLPAAARYRVREIRSATADEES